jgi:hypothetical protein
MPGGVGASACAAGAAGVAAWVLAEMPADVLHQMADDIAGGVAGQLAGGVAVLALPLRHLAHHRFELALDRLDLVLDRLALVLGQRLEHLRLHHLAVLPRRHREAGRGAQQGDVLGLGALLHGAERLLAAPFELLVDHFPAGAEFVALERRRERGAQLVDEALHRLGEPGALARRQ